MANKGGYQIIDFQNKNIDTSPRIKIPGIYNLIIGTNKPYLFSGIVIGFTEYDDCFAKVTIAITDCSVNLYGSQVRITDEDEVYIK